MVGCLLMLAGFSFVWWLSSPRVTLAWQTLLLLLLCLSQTLFHNINAAIFEVASFNLVLTACCLIASFSPLVLIVYLHSVARAYQFTIRGLPVLFAIGAMHVVLCAAALAINRFLFVKASHFGVLVILSGLIAVMLLQCNTWRPRYVVVVTSGLAVLWGFRIHDFVISNHFPSMSLETVSYGSGFSIAIATMLSLAFWVHHQDARLHKLDAHIDELLKNLKTRFRRAVARGTRTLSATLVAAQDTNREQTRLMAFIGHDLRAPMATVVGYARLLRDTDNPAHKKHITAIEHGAAHQLALIDELLDYVRGEFNLFGIKPVALDLCELLDDIGQQALTLAVQHNNSFVFALPESFPHWVMLDGNRLRQVLLNLISNAAKFTHDGTITLSLGASCQGASWTVSFKITDTGTGIAAADQERIFGSFEQAQSLDGGMGLGLFIARSIVQNMGGRLTLCSDLGIGSTFRFEVVLSHVDPVSLVPEPNAPAAPGTDLVSHTVDARWAQIVDWPIAASLVILTQLASTGQWTEINQWIVDTSITQSECNEFITLAKSLFDELDFKSLYELAAYSGRT